MKKIAVAILSLVLFSGCSLFSNEEREMEQTIPEITLKIIAQYGNKGNTMWFYLVGGYNKSVFTNTAGIFLG
ncbi:hypothetical protein HB825_09155 [Listeria booriae]|uniref:hypothetical protein n=1 Tax=Listeria booriae TaxID=1552123 RepID=UPI001629172A|nr:hypothetical protein [Listeria booriae]MBC1531500.1 hypothetical protein [Listeria booriae]MBC6135000.1 hypothetical protein [Listeria booriae]